MIVTTVFINVKKEYVEDFIKISRENHLGSIQEKGNFRFDILQDPNDRTKFMFYEAYNTMEDVALHKETSHYKKWKETVAGWMASDRTKSNYNILMPTE